MKKTCVYLLLEVAATIALLLGLFGSILGAIPDWLGVLLVLPAIAMLAIDKFVGRY